MADRRASKHEKSGLFARVSRWAKANLPTRDALTHAMHGNRVLRPLAHRVLRPELWRFTRRSVPRGVALGMVTGVLFPVAQVPFSALLALSVRANIPAAALTTFITNPVTTPPLWVFAYWIGRHILRFDAQVPGQPIATQFAANASWLNWLVSQAGPATIVGLLVLTAAMAIGGYIASIIGWRIWIARKWKARRNRVPARTISHAATDPAE